jgi:hypothetical protein
MRPSFLRCRASRAPCDGSPVAGLPRKRGLARRPADSTLSAASRTPRTSCSSQTPDGWWPAAWLPGVVCIWSTRRRRRFAICTRPTSQRRDRTRPAYAKCPGPLDPKLAALHGLSLRPAQAGRYTVYATNHGGRESIEVFELDARGRTPSAVWIGCVLMPNNMAAKQCGGVRRWIDCRHSAHHAGQRRSKTRSRSGTPAPSSCGHRRPARSGCCPGRASGRQRHRDLA